jgi:flagella basal body P-ring formation protein FlgA
MMPALLNSFAILFTLTLAHGVFAQERSTRQEPAALRETVEQFLHTQANGLPGQVSIAVGAVDSRLNLPACAAPEAFLPPGSRAWGKTTVGVRCTAPSAWTVYVSATVRVQGHYVATAAPLTQGQSIGPNDLTKVKGDLTTLPAGIITDPAQAVGRSMAISLPLGTPLRQDAMRSQQVVQQGQVVRLVSNGPGFQVSSEGRALNNANDGQITQARTQNGQVVSGVAKAGGIVEVAY